MNREERKYFYEKLRELFAEWVNDANTDIKSHIYDMITSFEERYMTNVTGQQPFPQELFRVFLEEHALVHKLQQRGAFKVVEELPTEDIDIYSIYLLRKGGITEEWIYFEGKWEFIGSTGIDPTDFQEKVDGGLRTSDKTIVGAINEVNSKIVVVDEQLSTTSKNPVQNDTITREIRATAQRIVEIERELSEAIINSDTENKESIGELESNVNNIVSNVNANQNTVIGITDKLRSDVNTIQSKNEQLQADLVAAQEKVQILEADNSALRKELAEVKQLTYAAL
jgi:predicted  nucleic acid-binding Zn-ribbon protein